MKKNIATTALTIGALGVVFGDIGTSPLYALEFVFGSSGQRVSLVPASVYGIISLIIWSLMLVVSIKFLYFIMQADSHGEGGIMSLVAQVKTAHLNRRTAGLFITLGLVGVALFYGDSAITPAISVLSAVEGLKVVSPSSGSLVIPIAVTVLIGLALLQRFGTNTIGKLFGPIMLLWFIAIAGGGLWQIYHHVAALQALLPTMAIAFIIHQPGTAFMAMTAVILAITGAEALYADMGHFGRPPIARAWTFIVFPALIICYTGQGALLLSHPEQTSSLLIRMFPPVLHIPFIILATLATIIASQSVISGAFSLTRQAIQLDLLPKLLIRHTSDEEVGQIYLPLVNWALFASVISLILIFGSSDKLANAYGIAVSGTLAADTILFLVVARNIWHKSVPYLVFLVFALVPIDLVFVAANVTKLFSGGILPIGIGAVVYLLISTWRKADNIVDTERIKMEGTLQGFIDIIHTATPPLPRIQGTAIYIGHHADLAPLALHATVEEMHELAAQVVIVTVVNTNTAHVVEADRVTFDELIYDDGICHITVACGFHENVNIPHVLRDLQDTHPQLNFALPDVVYIVSGSALILTKRHNLAHWRKRLYAFMLRNSATTNDYYKLPVERTQEMSTLIKL